MAQDRYTYRRLDTVVYNNYIAIIIDLQLSRGLTARLSRTLSLTIPAVSLLVHPLDPSIPGHHPFFTAASSAYPFFTSQSTLDITPSSPPPSPIPHRLSVALFIKKSSYLGQDVKFMKTSLPACTKHTFQFSFNQVFLDKQPYCLLLNEARQSVWSRPLSYDTVWLTGTNWWIFCHCVPESLLHSEDDWHLIGKFIIVAFQLSHLYEYHRAD